MTAVEQMIDEFNEELKVAIEIGNEDKIRIIKHLITIATSYLPKEREQIIDAHFDGQCDETEGYLLEIAEQYYNKTFKSE